MIGDLYFSCHIPAKNSPLGLLLSSFTFILALMLSFLNYLSCRDSSFAVSFAVNEQKWQVVERMNRASEPIETT
jgi:hypothetical protein